MNEAGRSGNYKPAFNNHLRFFGSYFSESLYDVMSIRLVKRKDISDEQAGATATQLNLEKDYWLFELGGVKKLDLSINVSGYRDFKFRLASLEELVKATTWNELPNHYAFLQKA